MSHRDILTYRQTQYKLTIPKILIHVAVAAISRKSSSSSPIPSPIPSGCQHCCPRYWTHWWLSLFTCSQCKLFHLLSVGGEIAFSAVCIWMGIRITSSRRGNIQLSMSKDRRFSRFSIEDNRVPILFNTEEKVQRVQYRGQQGANTVQHCCPRYWTRWW